MRRARLIVSAGVLIAGGLIWLQMNKTVGEGPVLISFSPEHGLVLADLLSVGLFGVAGWLLWKAR